MSGVLQSGGLEVGIAFIVIEAAIVIEVVNGGRHVNCIVNAWSVN